MSKPGLIYYKNDTNRYQDIKIKRLKKDFRGMGVSVHDYILNEIYRVNGYFVVWDDNMAFDVAEYWGIAEEDVNRIVAACCNIGLFNQDKFNKYGIITSRAIQTRYIDWSKQAKRAPVIIPEKHIILPEEYGKLPEETPKTPEELSPASKLPEETDIVENSIEEESKVEDLSDAAEAAPTEPTMPRNKWIETFDERAEAFNDSLKPYTNDPPNCAGPYTQTMIDAFFTYWTEPNRSRSKMRWETERTWELSRRLSTWAGRESGFKPPNQPASTRGPSKIIDAFSQVTMNQ